MTKARYPTKAVISRVVATARGLGIEVAGFEVSPDGTVKVIDARAASAQPAANDEFAEWEAKGLL